MKRLDLIAILKMLDEMFVSRKKKKPRKSDDLYYAMVLQARMERIVEKDKSLKEIAHNGFRSFLRAYSTHSKSTKHIFHPKKLNIGHVAKSFALRETPSELVLCRFELLTVAPVVALYFLCCCASASCTMKAHQCMCRQRNRGATILSTSRSC